MSAEEETPVDKGLKKFKKNKFLAPVIIAAIVIGGLATFSKDLATLVKNVSGLLDNRQATDVTDPAKIEHSVFKDDHSSGNIQLSENENNALVSLSTNKVTVDLSLNNEEGDFIYTMKAKDKYLLVRPYNDYLKTLEEGGPIKDLSFYYSPFDFQFPVLDLKITNNSEETIYFSRAVFSVSKSSKDLFPVLLTKKGYDMKLYIRNIGWGKVYNCRMLFKIHSSYAQVNPDSTDEALNIGDFEEFPGEIDLEDYYKKLGVNSDLLKVEGVPDKNGNLKYKVKIKNKDKMVGEKKYHELLNEAKGIFSDGLSVVSGKFIYEGINSAGKRVQDTVMFKSQVSLGFAGPGVPVAPSYNYDIKFETEKENYVKEIPLSQAIKPKESDRFNIRLFAPQTSKHQFKITLFYNDNDYFEVPYVSLDYFMSRADSNYVSAAKNPVKAQVSETR